MSDISKKRLKLNKKDSSLIRKYLISSLIGLAVLFIGWSLIAILLVSGMKLNGSTKIFIYVFICLGGFISGFLSHKKIKGRGIVNGLISSVVYGLISLILICFIMSFKISVGLFIIIPLIIACGCFGGVLEANI